MQEYPTLAEAKRHWRKETAQVVSDRVAEDVQKHGTTWYLESNGQPVMTIPGTSWAFYFRKMPNGAIYSSIDAEE
jgi:hypothetical protein